MKTTDVMTKWHRVSPLLAPLRHAAISELSLLRGVKQKWDFEPAKGSFWRAKRSLTPIDSFETAMMR